MYPRKLKILISRKKPRSDLHTGAGLYLFIKVCTEIRSFAFFQYIAGGRGLSFYLLTKGGYISMKTSRFNSEGYSGLVPEDLEEQI